MSEERKKKKQEEQSARTSHDGQNSRDSGRRGFEESARKNTTTEARLPFLELAKKHLVSRPLRNALKQAYGWTDSTPMTVSELLGAIQEWLGLTPEDERKRRAGR